MTMRAPSSGSSRTCNSIFLARAISRLLPQGALERPISSATKAGASPSRSTGAFPIVSWRPVAFVTASAMRDVAKRLKPAVLEMTAAAMTRSTTATAREPTTHRTLRRGRSGGRATAPSCLSSECTLG